MLNAKKRVAIAIIGILACGNAFATTPSPTHLRCTVVGTWACADGQTCKAGKGAATEHYAFDLAALTYQGPGDRGPITDLETNDGGFMSFVPGSGRLYVHKNTDDGDPMTSYLYLSPRDMRELHCTARYASATVQAETTARRSFVGHYYLSGVREVGSELLLRPDGSFAWFMSYGAVDQAAEGKWQAAGQTIVLDAATGAGRRPAFTQLRLAIDGPALKMPDGEGRYVRQP